MLRCAHCHLTLSEDELGDGCCPECFDVSGVRRYDFVPVPCGKDDNLQYRCDNCGVIVYEG